MPTSPVTPVTLLFSDIEGSTRRWEDHPRAMAVALARHDALMRSAIADAGGTVFKTIGDAFCAVFPTPVAAVAAAVTAQQALAAESWVEIGGLRVRMAIHQGEAEQRDNDYFGPSVNRVARLLGAAHGGQVLVSGPAATNLRSVPIAGVDLRDLGQHRLRDLNTAERLYQILAPDLPAEFPPPKTLDSQLRGLPVPPTPLLGREREVDTVRTLLGVPADAPRHDAGRLVTLTGPGGAGKTRLSLHLAATLAPAFSDGVLFVPLAALTTPELVLDEIATRLELPEGAARNLAAVIEALAPLDLLLVLDNFEQVMPAADLVGDFLAACAMLRVVATSRERLNLRGEQELPLPPLPLPAATASVPSGLGDPAAAVLSAVAASPAVQLFLERAQATRPSFALTAENAPTIAEICRRLDGLPLAIELAAARTRMLTPAAMLARLDRRLDLLAGGARDLPSRQQTMRNAVAWSYDLLSPDEQQLFARLAVFSGGAPAEAAESLVDGGGILSPLDFLALEQLADKSLVRLEPQPDETLRVTMFETIRDFAAEQLARGEETTAVARWHAQYFHDLAASAAPELDGPDQARWLTQLELDHANLRAALTWLREHDPALAVATGAALWRFWWRRGHLAEGRTQLAALARLAPAASAADQITVLNGAGMLAVTQGDFAGSFALHEAALALARDTGDEGEVAASLNALGLVALYQGDPATAARLLAENLALVEARHDLEGIANALTGLGNVAYSQEDFDEAAPRYEAALGHFRQLGDEASVANLLNNLSLVALGRGEFAAAEILLTEALAIRQGNGDNHGIGEVLNNLGEAARHQAQLDRAAELYRGCLRLAQQMGDHFMAAVAHENLAGIDLQLTNGEEAARHYAEALVLYRGVGDWLGIVTALHGLATLAIWRDAPLAAARLSGAATSFREANDVLNPPDPRHLETAAQRAATRDVAAFDAAWLVGAGMSLDRVVAAATAFVLETEGQALRPVVA